jgi:hypothetical protein
VGVLSSLDCCAASIAEFLQVSLDVEFSDKLESIGENAFACTALRSIKLPKVRVIDDYAFYNCHQLMEVELSEDLERIRYEAFGECPFRRIAIPLKIYLLQNDYVFDDCAALSQVDLVGGIHKTTSSLLLDSLINEMKDEIDRINRDLPNTDTNDKTLAIERWVERVLQRISFFKSEHQALLKTLTALLELALWKAKLDESQDQRSIGSDQPTKKTKIDMEAARQEQRITSGASIVIANVLPFLKLE